MSEMNRPPPNKTGGPTPVRLRFGSPAEFIRKYVEFPELKGIVIPTHVPMDKGALLELSIEMGAAGKGIRVKAKVVGFTSKEEAQGGSAGLAVSFVEVHPSHQKWLSEMATQIRGKPADSAEFRGGHMLRKAQSAMELEAAQDNIDFELAPEDGAVVGIDLGTSNTCACMFIDGKPQIIAMEPAEPPQTEAKRSMPSVVMYKEHGDVVVGTQALEGLRTHSKRTIYGAKRFIGRTYDSAAVQSMLGRFPYKVVPGPGGRVGIEINGRPINLTAVSAKILTAVKNRVEAFTKIPLQRAIVTVPAYYNDNQRNAVVLAGRLAGITVERILNEPTAAAVAYGMTHSDPRRILVYDLGGGTFDVSVMTVHNDSLQVLATAGDTFLGGEDFDDIIVRYTYEKHFEKTQKPLSQNHACVALVKEAAEKAKRRLSQVEKTMVAVRNAFLVDGTKTRIEVEISREAFEAKAKALVSRTLKICDMAMREARLEMEQISDVLLVGGQTRMPLVHRSVSKHFGRKPRCDLNPDEVVALGAGMLAKLSPSAANEALKDVLSMSIGVAQKNQFRPIIPRNSQLPCQKKISVSIAHDQWDDYRLEIWQGDSSELHKNELLGSIRVDASEPGEQDPVPMVIQLALTPDGLLEVTSHNGTTGEKRAIILNTSPDEAAS